MTTVKTLEQYLADIKQRMNSCEQSSANAFAEEIERLKNYSVSSNGLEKIAVLFGNVEFFPEYNNPAGFSAWVDRIEEGLHHQQISGLKSYQIPWKCCAEQKPLPYNNSFFKRTHLLQTKWRVVPVALEEAGWREIERYTENIHRGWRPMLSSFFGELRYLDDAGNILATRKDCEALFACNASDMLSRLEADVVGIPEAAIRYAQRKNPDTISAYVVGKASHILKIPNKADSDREIRAAAVRPLIRHVFGVNPPSDDELKATFLKMHGLKTVRDDYGPPLLDYCMKWANPEEAKQSMPDAAFQIYKDAKKANLFDGFSVGVLLEKIKTGPIKDMNTGKVICARPGKIIDTVLVGEAKGFRIPLCYWT